MSPDQIEPIIVQVHVDPGDPHNDQMAARVREDLDSHVESARTTLAQGDEVAVMAVIATALIERDDVFPRERLASMLAGALVRLAAS